MSDLYFSQRKLRATNSPDPKIGQAFWGAFLIYHERLARADYYTKDFASACGNGLPTYKDDDTIAKFLREELGEIKWPIPSPILPGTDTILDLIEFFFQHVAKPTKQQECSWCGGLHPKAYSVATGRYDYTVRINSLLERFYHPYRLSKGKITFATSSILDDRVTSLELKTTDNHLQRLLESALSNFYDRSGKKKLDGLGNIVDAFERLKTLEGSDKKASVQAVLTKLSSIGEISSVFDDLLTKLTELANKYTIRHHETDKIVLDDVELIDFLFYSYYNLVRLILEKYDLVVHSGSTSTGEDSDEIPF